MPQHVRVGTRASTLALTQTGHVANALAALAGPDGLDVETVRVRTDGDRLTGSLASLGGTGVFVTALRDALLERRCDVAVHSLKDLPTGPADGLALGAVPRREDPADVLCARDGLTLATLPAGARVGTGSPRRAAQLLAARPDLHVVDIRGNVDTRLRRVAPGDLDAVVLARAGLARLGRLDAVTQTFDPTLMAPAPGQGALAVEVRGEDAEGSTPLAQALRGLDHRPTRLAVIAERALLARLEAGCAAPVGALARLADDGRTLHLDAVVARTDGTQVLRRRATTPLDEATADATAAEHAAHELGRTLAEQLLSAGAADLADLGARP
ncbi:hydroxymethylbilane synthase [Cellulomonas soli]